MNIGVAARTAISPEKAALNGTGKGMAVDLKEEDVVVVPMYPGYVKTDLDTGGQTHSMKEVVEPQDAAAKPLKICRGKGDR